MGDERPLLERLDAGAWPQAANMQEAAARIRELLAQLPEGMKDCTIEFKECEYGHGRLVATNWVDHGCHFCRIRQQRDLLDECERFMGRTDEKDLNVCSPEWWTEFYRLFDKLRAQEKAG